MKYAATQTRVQSRRDSNRTFLGPTVSIGRAMTNAPIRAVICIMTYGAISSRSLNPSVVAAKKLEKTMTVFIPSS